MLGKVMDVNSSLKKGNSKLIAENAELSQVNLVTACNYIRSLDELDTWRSRNLQPLPNPRGFVLSNIAYPYTQTASL